MFEDFIDDDMDDGDDEAPDVQEAGELPAPRETPDLLGHESVEKMLAQFMAQGTLPHAIIFAGPQGIGKSTLAFRLTRLLLSSPSPPGGKGEGEGMFGLFGAEPEHPLTPAGRPEPSPLGGEGLYVDPTDPIFHHVASGGHPDLMVVERPFDEKKGRRKDSVDIESIRKIAPFMRMTASRADGWRVVIVDDADTMTRQAQNAILKILEEPPQRALLMLIAHRPGLLIPTIRSRCRMVTLQPLAHADFGAMVRKLQPGASNETLNTLYALTGGSIGQAQKLIETGGIDTLVKLAALLAHWPSWDWPAVHILAEALGRPGQDDAYRITDMLLRWSIDQVLRFRSGASALPALLAGLKDLAQHYSLPEWIDIQEKLAEHLDRIRFANLDKRQGIIGTFTILSGLS